MSASGQNVFFAEILTAFGDALREHGLAVEESVDCFPPPASDLVYLFVPHEYHPLVHELAHPSPVQLRRSIALCTEQPGTDWLEISAELAAGAGAVVDINAVGTGELRRRGMQVEHAPLGYVPAWDHWQGAVDDEREIDVAFLGAHNERRAKALARCVPALADRPTAIHLVETTRPHVADSPYFLSHDRKWELLANTKILLNIHRGKLAYMEWHRVLGAAINGCVVLSEHSVGVDPLVPGEHFISADYDDIPGVLEGLLSDPDRIERIRSAAYNLLRERLPMSAAVDALLRASERAARAEVPVSRRRPPATPPMPQPLPASPPEWEAHADWLGERLPVRSALKHLVVQTRELSRQVHDLSNTGKGGVDTLEHLGPRRDTLDVSVLLTVHNYADVVGEALRSVAIADLETVEAVVVDDGSVDGSADAVRAACDEHPWLTVQLVQRAANGGLPAARNLALAHARADLVFVLDADNTVLPRGLSRLAQALEAQPEAAFAYGIVQAFDPSGPVGVMNWLDWDPARMRQGNYIDAMAMIRRAALEEVGGYPADPVLYGWEDFAVWIAMADAGMSAVRVPDFVARYRTAPHSMLGLTDINHSAAWAVVLHRYPWLAKPQSPKRQP